jgi:Polyketide cyclase / dehydrase and lipid transport
VVESLYKPGEKIEFHRADGEAQSLKDFNGSWEIRSLDNGTKSALTYSMYMDPGFFVPQWLIREGVKGELPRTLSAIKKRVDAVSAKREKLEPQTIAAGLSSDSVATKLNSNPL